MKNKYYSKTEILSCYILILIFLIDGIIGRPLPNFLEHIAATILIPLGLIIFFTSGKYSEIGRWRFREQTYFILGLSLGIALTYDLTQMYILRELQQSQQVLADLIGTIIFVFIQKRKV